MPKLILDKTAKMINIKLITSIVLTALITFTIGLFEIPWYSFTLGIFIIFTAIPQKPNTSFLVGFLTVLVLSAIITLKTDFKNEHLLSKKVSEIFMLKDKFWLLHIITAFIFGLLGGLSALTGSLFRKTFKKKRKNYYY